MDTGMVLLTLIWSRVPQMFLLSYSVDDFLLRDFSLDSVRLPPGSVVLYQPYLG